MSTPQATFKITSKDERYGDLLQSLWHERYFVRDEHETGSLTIQGNDLSRGRMLIEEYENGLRSSSGY